MFDLTENVELELPTHSGSKVCLVRQPTDAEWTKRFETRYTLVRNLQGGQSEQKIMNQEEADSTLLSAIQINKDVVFDPAEAILITDQLANCEVIDVSKAGGKLHITLNTILGEVEHDIVIPSHKQLRESVDKCVSVRGGKFNTSTVRLKLAPAAELYDKCAEAVQGYTEGALPKDVPIVHKYKVIDVLNSEISAITTKAKPKGNEDHPTSPGPTLLP